MTPEEFKEARQSLRLSLTGCAKVLDSDPTAIRKTEQPESTSQHRKPAPRMVRLMEAYLAGYRPPDWPEEEICD